MADPIHVMVPYGRGIHRCRYRGNGRTLKSEIRNIQFYDSTRNIIIELCSIFEIFPFLYGAACQYS